MRSFPILAALFLLHISILGVFPKETKAQQKSLKLGTTFPQQYAIGVDIPVDSIWSVGFDVGYVEYPHDEFIFELLKASSLDSDLFTLIDRSYDKGSIASLRIKRNSDWGFWGVLAQKITLRAEDAPVSIYEAYFDVDISQFPIRGFQLSAPTSLKLTSRMYQLGLWGGKEWPLPFGSSHWHFRVEAAITANVASQNSLESPDRILGSFSSEVDQELKDAYRKYAFIPTVGVFLSYRW